MEGCKDARSRSIKLFLYVRYCGVVATWTKSGCLQCLLGEDVLATLKWVATVFCQSCSRWDLELGSGWLHCLRTLPVCSQLGNLVALPTYTACISCGLATWQLESGCLACLHCLCSVYTAYFGNWATWVPCLPTLPVGRPQVRRLRGGREEVAFLTPRISPVRAN